MCYCLKFEFDPRDADSLPGACSTIEPPARPCIQSLLPSEILIQIAKSLNDHKWLNNLCRVNKYFNHLLTPILYSKFDSAFCKQTLFLTTLSSTSVLAPYIKHLRWHDEDETWDSSNADYEPSLRHDIAGKISALPSLFYKQLAIAIEHAIGGTLHVALLAATLSLAPNVEVLDATLSTTGTSRIRWNEAVWIGSPHQFTHLHTVRIKLRRSSGMDLNPLFLLPAVRTLDLTHVDRLLSDPQKTMWLPLPERSSNVEALYLRESNVEMEILVPVVRACRGLRTLLYQHSKTWTAVKKIDMVALSAALSGHRETLRNLGIMDRQGESDDSTALDGIMGVPKLENVLLPLSSSSSKDSRSTDLALPPQARHLSFTVKGDNSRKTFEKFLSACSRAAPRLKQDYPLLLSITVYLAEKELTSSLVSFMAKQACKKGGVRLDFKVLDSEKDVSTAVVDWESHVAE